MSDVKQQSSADHMVEDCAPLIAVNDNSNIIKHDGASGAPEFLRQEYPKLGPGRVIDHESLELVQVLDLHQAVDFTTTAIGSAVLLRSLVQPSVDLSHIEAKQESLREIAANDSLRQALRDFVREYALEENALFKFFNKGLHAAFPYPALKKARQAAANIIKTRPDIPLPESSYLKQLLSNFQSYQGSVVDRLMTGDIYQTFGGLKSKGEVGLFTPKARFIPGRFTKWIAAGPLVALAPIVNSRFELGLPIPPVVSTVGLVLTGAFIFYGLFIKPIRDTEKFVEPLRKKCVADQAFGLVIDSVGRIDELLSCHDFAHESSHASVLPKITAEERHAFMAAGLGNPVVAREKPDFVPNDVRMNGARLTFISGPNSGGKTTICKTIVHNQLLAQMGCYVLAEKAAVSIADLIRYQAPKFDGLKDDEGRFGTELSRTRDIFYATTPRSLVILDELAEGTTVEERLHQSHDILSDFYTIGNNTILVTHNHSLIDRFSAESKGQCLMVEFKEDQPTYRLKPGVSRVSHAERIAAKINFSREDRHRYMKEKGYL